MSEDLSIEIMHEYNSHKNIPWNIVEYQPVPQYLGKDVIQNMENRYTTRKGCFMDGHIKIVKDLPEPGKYPTKSCFDQSLNKEKSKKIKINPRLKRGSYHDEIVREGKKTKIGVGTYHLQKTDKQIQKELRRMSHKTRMSKDERPSFYQDLQVQSLIVPGAGNYNPHLQVDHIRTDRMDADKWIKKHKSQFKNDVAKKKKIPGPSSYRPVSAGTFNFKQAETQKNRKKSSASLGTHFGTDARFSYCRPSKKKILEQRPDPTRYELSITWRGKKDSTKQQGWKSVLSTRPHSASVYH